MSVLTRSLHVHFGSFHLDLEREVLLKDGQEVQLRPKAWLALVHLALHQGQLISIEDFLDELWPNQTISLKLLTNLIGEVRRALGDDLRQPAFIQTVHRRGYRFIAPVTTLPNEAPVVATSARTWVPPAVTVDQPFVGRAAELAQVAALAASAWAGQSRWVMITGEAGVGKSRLLRNFLVLDEPLRPWRVFTMSCFQETFGAEPFGPVLQLFAQMLSAPDIGLSIEDFRALAPCWLAHVSIELPVAELEALRASLVGVSAARMLREGVALIENLARKAPLVLAIEDTQWADSSTLSFLSTLLRQLRAARLLVVVTQRSGDELTQSSSLMPVARRLQADGLCRVVHLNALTELDVECFLRARFGPHPWTSVAARHVFQRTGGLALYVNVLVDQLVEQSALSRATERGDWQWNPEVIGAGLPVALRQLILDQLHGLGSDQVQLLKAASALGQTFTAPLMAITLGWPVAKVEQVCLEISTRPRFIVSSGPKPWAGGRPVSSYRLSHALLAEAIAETVPVESKCEWNGRAARALEAAFANHLAPVAFSLALHFARAGSHEDTVRVLRIAARVANQRFAHEDACLALSTAIEHMERFEAPGRQSVSALQLSWTMVSVLENAFGYAAAETESARDALLARSKSGVAGLDAYLVQRTLCVRHLFGGRADLTLEPGQRMLAIAQRECRSEVASGHLHLGLALIALGRLAEGRDHFERSLKALHGVPVATFLSTSVTSSLHLAHAQALLGQLDNWAARLSELDRSIEAGCSPLQHATVLFWTAESLRLVGCHDEARRRYESCLGLATAHDLKSFLIVPEVAMSVMGDACDIDITCAQRHLARRAETGERWGQLGFQALLARAMVAQGRLTDAQSQLEESKSCMAHWPYSAPGVLIALADLHLARGEPEEAVQTLRRACRMASEQGSSLMLLDALELWDRPGPSPSDRAEASCWLERLDFRCDQSSTYTDAIRARYHHLLASHGLVTNGAASRL